MSEQKFHLSPELVKKYHHMNSVSGKCISAHMGEPTCNEQGCNRCEVMDTQADHTFHTHPKGTPYLSVADVVTNNRLGKKVACVGLVPQDKIVCFDVTQAKLHSDIPSDPVYLSPFTHYDEPVGAAVLETVDPVDILEDSINRLGHAIDSFCPTDKGHVANLHKALVHTLKLLRNRQMGEPWHEPFTKRDYTEIGNLLRHARDIKEFTEALIATFKADNPRFNERKFREFLGQDVDRLSAKEKREMREPYHGQRSDHHEPQKHLVIEYLLRIEKLANDIAKDKTHHAGIAVEIFDLASTVRETLEETARKQFQKAMREPWHSN